MYSSDKALDDPKNHVSCIVKEKREHGISDPVTFISQVPLDEATTSINDRIAGNQNSYVVNNVSALRDNKRVSDTTSGPKHVSLPDVEVSEIHIPVSKPITDSLSSVTYFVGDNLEESELSVIVDHNSKSEPESSIPRYFLAKQEHAYAGAMAGICVSLCLHPIDTIKNVVQSCRANQTSLSDVSRSIVSERDVPNREVKINIIGIEKMRNKDGLGQERIIGHTCVCRAQKREKNWAAEARAPTAAAAHAKHGRQSLWQQEFENSYI